jgi:orotate phosphoribosyltransferase-like protein
MIIDWKMVGAAGSIISGIAIMHGLSTRKWRHIHTFGVVLGIAAGVAPLVKRARALRTALAPEAGTSATPASG